MRSFTRVLRVLVLATIATLLCRVSAAGATTSSLDLVSQSLNHVEVSTKWSGQDNACHTLNWGDGSWVDLCGSEGDETKGHDYEYAPGDVETYEVSFLGETLEIVIDDRPSPTHSVYLPFVVRQNTPVCTIKVESQQLNRLNFDLQWSGGEEWNRLLFGDDAYVDLKGRSGFTFVPHDYRYTPGGITTYQATFMGSLCSVEVTIDDRH
ncbi:MAG TPA: hypothetical protein VMX76_03875 [Nevskiaceae bacterium]|nr:hypothetical protein [Nevskiaceae bacterium]